MQDPARPTPKQRHRRKEARPGEIISAALRLWIENGFANTRLEDVAKRAGIAKGTIYLYFPSKEALFEAALRDRLVTMMDRTGNGIQNFEGSTADLLDRLFDAVQAELEGGAGAFLKILVAEGHRFPELAELYETAVIRHGMATIRAILVRGVARGELRPRAEETDPRLIMAPAIVGAIFSMIFPGSAMLMDREALRAHVRMTLKCLGSP